MKLIFAKIICFLFGHKLPIEDKPLLQITSGLIDGMHYSYAKMPCKRCIVYEKKERYTSEEWNEITKKAINDFINQVESASNQLDQEIKEYEEQIKHADASISKMVH